MSFNIRYGTANDGDNHWKNRKSVVAQVIIDVAPDIVGTQETLDFQADFLKQKLPDYTYVGRSRQLNAKRGEQCGIFFRTERFIKLAEGHFWLSETSDRPGSKSWDSSLPRMATWVKLWDQKSERSFVVVNTHFDHRGKTARLESAKLIRRFVKNLSADTRHVVVTGDFNAGEASAPYKALFQPADDKTNSNSLVDTFRVHRRNPSKTEGTFGGFNGTQSGARIDWIACTHSFVVRNAAIVSRAYDKRYPSDHYPVTAELDFAANAPGNKK